MEQPGPITEEQVLPSSIDVTPGELTITPNELRSLKAETGRTMEDLMGEAAEDADRMQALVWLELRRKGHTPSWDDAADVGFHVTSTTTPKPDPTPTDTSPD